MKTCDGCGVEIRFNELTQKWVTSSPPDKRQDPSWHCGNDPDFPVKAHLPAVRR